MDGGASLSRIPPPPLFDRDQTQGHTSAGIRAGKQGTVEGEKSSAGQEMV